MKITIDPDGWIKEAIGIYFPNRSWGAFTSKPRQIVLHGTAWPGGTAQIIASEWATTNGDASAHLIVNKDGTFVQGISLNCSAWANCCLTDNINTGEQWNRTLPVGNQNNWSIAIEHCKDDPNCNSDELTDAQQAASFALVNAICDYHHIPKQVIDIGDITHGGIIRHKDIDQANRPYCPGPYPFSALQDFLKGAQHMLVPAGWKDDGTHLIAPNKHFFVKGFRQHVLASPDWDPNDQPLEEEQQVSQIELHTNLGPGARQLTMGRMLVYTEARGVKESAAGAEIAACYALIATLRKQLEKL